VMDVTGVAETFGRWLHLPDPLPLYAVLGAVAANRLEGDPVWLVLVGPPSGGKSELLQAVGDLPDVHPTATLTEAALLSGTPKRDRGKAAKGGLLREIGEFGILLCKDFGSVLGMNRDARAAVLAALREVYDGSWTRHLGTDGGRTESWSGKVGLLAGCTPTIDRHHAVMGAMGERFVLVRLPEADAEEQARRALDHAGREREMRGELRGVVCALFEGSLGEPRPPSLRDRERLVALATFVVRCRSAVERDSYSREVELVPEAEAPTRLVVVLERLLAGLDAVGVDRRAAWRVVTRAALDSIPALRRAVIEALHVLGEGDTRVVADAVRYPTTTARRALEDLNAHGVVCRFPQGEGKADRWALTGWAQAQYVLALTVPGMSGGEVDGSVPEKSEGAKAPYIHTNTALEDFSGTVPERGKLRAIEGRGA
jgi:hypothetical protein